MQGGLAAFWAQAVGSEGRRPALRRTQPELEIPMTYAINGLSPHAFDLYRGLDDDQLAGLSARRITVTSKPGFPCRITLEDADVGESVILLHHVSHDVATPYRSAYAIYVRENALAAATYRDSIPPVFLGRPLAMRAFSPDAMLLTARLALPGEAEAAIVELMADAAIEYVDVHNAAHGCFAARVERS